jgi:hypothetical protein
MLLAGRIVGKKAFDCTSFTFNLSGKQEFSTLFHKVCTGSFCLLSLVWCRYRLVFVCMNVQTRVETYSTFVIHEQK